MTYRFRILGTVFALALTCAHSTAFAESDMPIVTDIPLEQADYAESEDRQDDPLTHAQQMLIDLGYLYGQADGIYGPATQAAMNSFQERQGLEITDELNDETLSALEEMQGTVAQSRAIQQRLIDLGYLRGSADGIFGEHSQAALKQFQALNGLEATGVIDDATSEALFSEDARVLPARLTGGDKGDAVVALQEKLIQYGFMNGEADGSYGKQTIAAVKRFQNQLLAQGVDERLGIEASGEATPVTQMLLFDEEYSSYIRDIVVGEESDEVNRVERRLAKLGFMDAEADETFDNYAVSAARAFQAAAGIGQDAFDRAFIDALFSLDAPVAERFVPHDIAYGDKGQAVREVEEALVQGGMTIRLPTGSYNDYLVEGVRHLYEYLTAINSPQAALFADPETMTVGAQQMLIDGLLDDTDVIYTGMASALTTRVQRRLHTLYYLPRYSVDGDYGEITQQAMAAFQEDNGLVANGNAEKETLRLLFSADANCKQYPYRVEVDISSQRVYVFQLNESGVYEQVQTFKCSTGVGNSTPRGIFLNGSPANVWHHFKKFDVWARYSFEIEGDIMFHSVLFDEKDPDTLREGSLYALGQKASHGCVRLAVKDAKWLFEHCKRGSLVILIY